MKYKVQRELLKKKPRLKTLNDITLKNHLRLKILTDLNVLVK
jgi:hypothetical protein